MNLENFSEECQKILSGAVAESKYGNQFYLGTEHIFIALCKTNDEEVKEIFRSYNINPLLRREVREATGSGTGTFWGKEILFTPRVNKILSRAEEICFTNKLEKIEPIHLFLALLQGGDGVAVRVLKSKGIKIKDICKDVEARIITYSEEIKLYPSTQKTPFLNKVGRDITLLARQGKIEPIIGRNNIIKRIAQILTMKKKNNPILVGEAGVGKTAIVEGLALRLIRNDVPDELKNTRIIEINLSALIAGTSYRGEFEEKILKMINEASQNKEIVLFIDEIHNLIGAGRVKDSSIDASNILKPALSRGEIRCIGATTIDEYRKYFEKDSAFERRFQSVFVSELSPDDSINLLRGVKKTYESHYKFLISDEAIKAAVNLSVRYIPSRRLPDKALDLIDQAASKKKFGSLTIKPEDKEQLLKGENLNDIQTLSENDIIEIVAEMTGIPIQNLTEEESDALLHIEEILSKRVMGQDKAINLVANTIRTSKTGLQNLNRPLGVFLFLGPSGVGKTELAKALAEYLFKDEKRIIRFDMSEYMEPHTVSKLIGSPPGYVGYEEEGQLTGPIKTYPYSVVLLDEIEKAHPDVLNIFLQVFDDGRLTDAKGKTADFKNSIIIMTSNIASDKKNLGFLRSIENKDRKAKHEIDESNTKSELKNLFRPEFLNRIDKVVVFNRLGKDNLASIIDKLLKEFIDNLQKKYLQISFDKNVYNYLIENGYSETYGVREMARLIHTNIIEPVAGELLKGRFSPGDTIRIKTENDHLKIYNENDFKTRAGTE